MSGRRMLKLVAEPAEQRPGKLFCGHCAREPESGPAGDDRLTGVRALRPGPAARS